MDRKIEDFSSPTQKSACADFCAILIQMTHHGTTWIKIPGSKGCVHSILAAELNRDEYRFEMFKIYTDFLKISKIENFIRIFDWTPRPTAASDTPRRDPTLRGPGPDTVDENH